MSSVEDPRTPLLLEEQELVFKFPSVPRRCSQYGEASSYGSVPGHHDQGEVRLRAEKVHLRVDINGDNHGDGRQLGRQPGEWCELPSMQGHTIPADLRSGDSEAGGPADWKVTELPRRLTDRVIPSLGALTKRDRRDVRLDISPSNNFLSVPSREGPSPSPIYPTSTPLAIPVNSLGEKPININ